MPCSGGLRARRACGSPACAVTRWQVAPRIQGGSARVARVAPRIQGPSSVVHLLLMHSTFIIDLIVQPPLAARTLLSGVASALLGAHAARSQLGAMFEPERLQKHAERETREKMPLQLSTGALSPREGGADLAGSRPRRHPQSSPHGARELSETEQCGEKDWAKRILRAARALAFGDALWREAGTPHT